MLNLQEFKTLVKPAMQTKSIIDNAYHLHNELSDKLYRSKEHWEKLDIDDGEIMKGICALSQSYSDDMVYLQKHWVK